MKLKLNAVDRLEVASLIPAGSSMSERSIIRGIEAKFALTAEEAKAAGCGLNDKGNVVVHPTKSKEVVVEIELTEPELVYLKGRLDKADKGDGVSNTNYELCLAIQGATVGA